jgi:hypothetical protein
MDWIVKVSGRSYIVYGSAGYYLAIVPPVNAILLLVFNFESVNT